MKKPLASCLIVALLCSVATPLAAQADEEATPPVELSQLISSPLPIREGRQMLPLRESLRLYPHADITWDGEGQIAGVTVNGRHIAYPIGQLAFDIDGQRHPLDAASFIQAGRTYIPLRALVQALDGRIEYTADRRTLLYLPKAETPAPQPTADHLKEALYRFSAKTAAPILAAGKKESQTYSPLSLYMAMSLLTPGAAGQTATTLNQFLDVRDATEAARQNSALFTLQKEDPCLFLANSLWLDDELVLKSTYRKTLEKAFHSESHQVDLQKAADLTKISQWIAEQTRDRIKVDFEPQAAEQLKLINALYFKDKWQTPFNTDFNVTQPFTRADGKTVSLPMMTNELAGRTLHDDAFDAAALPYENGAQMIFILPKAGQSTQALLKNDAFWSRIAAFRENSKEETVAWTLAPFYLKNEFKLKEPLAALGLENLFSSGADFSGISDTNLSVSSVDQFTDLRLDNEGTEAAAVTIVSMVKSAAPEPAFKMTLDRPFLFILADQNQLPLFIGEVAEPKTE